MPAARALTRDQVLEVCRLYRMGVSGYELGRRFHCSPTTIWKYLHQEGVRVRPARYPRGRSLDGAEVLRTCDVAAKAGSLKEAAEILGIPRQTLRSRLKKYAR